MGYIVKQLINLVINLQNNNGSFSSEVTNSSDIRESIYFTSLIVISLATIPESNRTSNLLDAIDKAIRFLISQQSTRGSWNYFPRTIHSPYPDDLDDTFLALRAIELWRPEFITPSVLATTTNLLISCETQPGGPYRTWITHHNNSSPWNDVDTVINQTIYNWLRTHAINIPPLKEFIDRSYTENSFQSEYYHNPYFVSYLTHQPLNLVTSGAFQSFNVLHPINTVLEIITSDDNKTTTDVSSLINQAITSTSRYPFFIETNRKNHPEYAGCRAFEICLCIEALLTKEPLSVLPTDKLPLPNQLVIETINTTQTLSKKLATKGETNEPIEQRHLTRVRETITSYFNKSPFAQEYFVKQFDVLVSNNLNEVLIPYNYYSCLREPFKSRIDPETLVLITAAHSLGLISFTLQDSLVDKELSSDLIPLVTSGVLGAQNLFQQVLYAQSSTEIITLDFHLMNEALLRETSKTPIDHLSAGELYMKSIGLICGVVTIIVITGGEHGYNESSTMRKIFTAYLNVRQVLDDLHDWENDIRHGITTPVVSALNSHLKPSAADQAIALNATTEAHAVFWDKVFPNMYRTTRADIETAITQIYELPMSDSLHFFESLFSPISQALDSAEQHRNHYVEFIDTYEKTTLASGS